MTQSAVVAGATLAAPYALAKPSPSSTLGVAVIGVGGMGGYSVDAGLAEHVVAIADIDDGNLSGALAKIAQRQKDAPKVYNDYRVMLDTCHKDIDVVLIATPDHHHAPAAIRAIARGKHVFCQKPLTHNIYEAHALMRAAREHKVLTQMGNQGHCGEGLRRACEYLWSGAAGNVKETHTILGRNFGGKGGRPAPLPVPMGVHWDTWIGPSPYRDYHEGLHPFSWRSWRAFGTGNVGDMACHNLDAVFSGLKVGLAKHITVECLATNGGSEEMWAQDNIVRYDVPARAGMVPVSVYVYDHKDGLYPDIMKKTEAECDVTFGECTLYIGDKNLFWTTGAAGQARILPLDKHAAYPEPRKILPRAHGGPIEDLFWCIKHGGSPCSNFPEQSGPLTAFVLLGHLAQIAGVGKRVEWDVEKMRCTNMPEINQHIRRQYRPGWEV
jgi:predicted dehydrogenase